MKTEGESCRIKPYNPNNIAVLGRNQEEIEVIAKTLMGEAEPISPKVNEDKTKYMILSRKVNPNNIGGDRK